MHKQILLTLIVIALALAACGARPQSFIGRENYLIGSLYVMRDNHWNIVQSRWCWSWDSVCNQNPMGYPVPAGE